LGLEKSTAGGNQLVQGAKAKEEGAKKIGKELTKTLQNSEGISD